MRLYYDATPVRTSLKKSFELPVGPQDNINLLILIHLAAFALFMAFGGTAFFGDVVANPGLRDQARDFLALSARVQDVPHHWLMSLFTYQFIHFRAGEVLLSVTMLWIFGHILQQRIGQYRVIVYYFVMVVLSAVVFNVAHILFPIFADPSGILDGAFGGVLGIMTTTVLLYGRLRFSVGRFFRFRLWQLYAAAILVSLVVVCKDNMAYLLVYAFGIYAGAAYGRHVQRSPRGRRSVAAPHR